jgi:hypothetical protein
MVSILGRIPFAVKDSLSRNLQRRRDADVRLRYLIVINPLNGRSTYQIAPVLQRHHPTVCA